MAKESNLFLSSLNERLANEGESIVIEGRKFFIVLVDLSQNGKLLLESERIAKANLISDMAALKKQVLTVKEKNEAIAGLIQVTNTKDEIKAISDSINEMKTRYDLDIYFERMRVYGDLFMVESIRNTDGSKIYSTMDERKEIVNMLSAYPDTKQEILDKIQLVQKKSIKSEKQKSEE